MSAPSEQENPFRPPQEPRSNGRKSSFAFLLACLIWSGIAIKMMVIRPIAFSFFEEFEVELPTLTLWFLSPPLTLFSVLIAVTLISSSLFVTSTERRGKIGRRALLLAAAFVLLFALSIGVALFNTIEALS